VATVDTPTTETTAGEQPPIPRRLAWVNLTSVGGAHAFLHATTVLLPLIFPILHDQYGFSYTQIGLIGAAANIAGGLLQVVFGYLTRYVARKTLIGLGNLTAALGMLLTGTATTFAPFLAWSVVRSVGSAPQHPVGNSLLADTFGRARRGAAIAAHVAAGNIGTLAVPLVGAALIARLGWQPAVMLFALPGILAGTSVLLFAREPAAPAVSAVPTREPAPTWRARWAGALAPLRHRGVLLVIAASVLAAGGRGLGIVTKYVPLYLQGPVRLPPATVSVLYTVLLAGSVVGPLAAGRLSDRLGRRTVLYLSYIAAAVFTALLLAVTSGAAPSVALIVVELALMGLVIYAEAPLLQAYLIDQAPDGERDAALGWYFTIAYSLGSVWDAILGALIDRAGFVPAFALMAASYLAAMAVLSFVPGGSGRRRVAP
jgi:MFS transporter, FSR family, fosmidomycin resistance protein